MQLGGIRPELNSVKVGDIVQANVNVVGRSFIDGKLTPWRGPKWINFTVVDDKYTGVDWNNKEDRGAVIAINRVNKMIKGGALRIGWQL